jgi:hypothetical protein
LNRQKDILTLQLSERPFISTTNTYDRLFQVHPSSFCSRMIEEIGSLPSQKD